ncbi:MAG TPA: efflux RND transporter periplasmic adaptor subunit [Verrucomicrobiota bacterium]|nr:efflux RND transporter periplasmic adaptor subunit [Verrucomicrobiota bacterium]HNU49866.1 efflux RND transporter periplasmic adaptor subunit [Verrucomicrobiota bacterium]
MSATSSFGKAGTLVRRRPLVLGLAVLGVGLLLYLWLRSPGTEGAPTGYHEVRRGDFTVSVVEGGNLAAVSEVSIRNDVEGTARIISIVPEGSYVKKGDLLVELDSAQAQDQVNQQQISYEKAVFAVEQARAQLEIQRSATNSDYLAALLKLKFAEIDRDKYLQGQMLVDLMEASNKLVSAQSQLVVNEDSLSNSVLLAAKGYETKTKVDGDRLTVLNNQNSLIVASNGIWMLRAFDIPKQTNKFSSDVLQAQQELDRVIVSNLRRMAQYEADLSAQSNTLILSEQKLARDRRNLTNTTIRAPQDGLVVYAVSDSHFSSESLIEGGATVRNRQELIKLPDLSRMKVNIKVHESHITMIRPGLPAFVVLDSMPDQRFAAVVARVAPLPDTQTRWGNPNLKVYNTDVHLTEEIPNVKPGVSAKAEIIITNIADTLSVPIQAVTTHKGKQVVYVVNGSKPEPRSVETGMYNTKFIQILQGLKEGERVLLAPPFDLQEKDLEGSVLTEDEKIEALRTNTPARTTLPQEPAAPGGRGENGAPDAAAGAPGGDAAGSGMRSREGRGRGMGFNREEMLKQFDTNGDGELDEDERAAIRQRLGGPRTNRTDRPTEGGDTHSPASPGGRPNGMGGNRPEAERR